jgi:hypothetical protein
VFTVPHLLNPLCRNTAKGLYDLLFRAAAQTMIEVAADPQHLGAEIGFLAILHTWGQNLSLHPHIHCLVPAGGLSADHTQWIQPRYNFFLPVKVLSRVFRGKFVDGLRRAYRRHRLSFGGGTAYLQEPKKFDAFLRTLFKQDWVVYAKPAFGGPTQVLHYLGRYTHRVAISNHRLLAFDGQKVSFRWRDYARGNKRLVMMLSAGEFLRRYVQHVLPLGFVRIRQFGFLANGRRASALKLVQKLLAITTKPCEPTTSAVSNSITWTCPRCGGTMRMQLSFTAAQLRSQCRPLDSS